MCESPIGLGVRLRRPMCGGGSAPPKKAIYSLWAAPYLEGIALVHLIACSRKAIGLSHIRWRSHNRMPNPQRPNSLSLLKRRDYRHEVFSEARGILFE